MALVRTDKGARGENRTRRAIQRLQIPWRTRNVSADAHARYNECVVVDTTTGAVTISIPTPVGNRDQQIAVKNFGAAGHNATLDAGAKNIDHATTLALTDGKAVVLISDNTRWVIVAAR